MLLLIAGTSSQLCMFDTLAISGYSPAFSLDMSVQIPDSDEDGMPDAWEDLHGLLSDQADAAADPDADGYSNIEEYNANLDPHVAESRSLPSGTSSLFALALRETRSLDVDGDGMPDDWEEQFHLFVGSADGDDDRDGDGLTNLDEYNRGSNPLVWDARQHSSARSSRFLLGLRGRAEELALDSDNDGMPDWWELKYGLDSLVDDSAGDFDDDDVLNGEEYIGGRDPTVSDIWLYIAEVTSQFAVDTIGLSPDSDGDGMRDEWEQENGLDYTLWDSHLDPDQDGRSNLEEYNAGTDPQIAERPDLQESVSNLFSWDSGAFRDAVLTDSDGDGMPDWWETKYGLDATTPDDFADLDADGLPNGAEYDAGSDPTRRDVAAFSIGTSIVFLVDTGAAFYDSDRDGLPDWWEMLQTGTATGMDAATDLDGDTMSNLAEFIARTDPFDPDSALAVTSISSPRSTAPDQVLVEWDARQGRLYRAAVQHAGSSAWVTAQDSVALGDGKLHVVLFPAPSNEVVLIRVEVMRPDQ